jgi:hypothetical protein
VKLYATTDIEFPHLKAITLAQWMLESGRGSSFLAKEHNNFGGMMWRDEMFTWNIGLNAVEYTSPSDNIKTFYVSCGTQLGWIKCYWRFIDRAPYIGWRNKVRTGYSYLAFIKECGYAADPNYVDKVLALLPEANEILYSIKDDTHSEGESMPKVDIERSSPNQSERNGTLFRIILHNTDGKFDSALSWLCNSASQVSAHLLIGRDGKVAQMVPFHKKAWHAGPANSQSIGIELEATNNQKGMTPIQEKVLVEWLKYLMAQYNIEPKNIIGHREVMNTSCPGLVWPTTSDLVAWKQKNLTNSPKPEPIPHPNEPEVTWFELHKFQDGIGCIGYNGSEPKVTYRGKSSIALVDFLKRWGDHNILVAPESKPWPGNTR